MTGEGAATCSMMTGAGAGAGRTTGAGAGAGTGTGRIAGGGGGGLFSRMTNDGPCCCPPELGRAKAMVKMARRTMKDFIFSWWVIEG